MQEVKRREGAKKDKNPPNTPENICACICIYKKNRQEVKRREGAKKDKNPPNTPENICAWVYIYVYTHAHTHTNTYRIHTYICT